jgi:outer membrane receptor protein involved in Fe transport
VDFIAGERIALSATVFDQRVEGLIQHVIPNPRTSPRTVQQQNVGRISNRGSEGQATVRVGPADLQIGVATVISEVEALSNAYSGDLRVGDRLPEVPSWSGHGSLSLRMGRIRATGGATVVGPWTGYDWVSYYSDLAQGADVPASIREYWIEYPSIARPYVMVSTDGASGLHVFGRVDNLTNQQRDARDNLQVTAGRTTSLGLTVRF